MKGKQVAQARVVSIFFDTDNNDFGFNNLKQLPGLVYNNPIYSLVKIFDSREEAVAWAKSFLPKMRLNLRVSSTKQYLVDTLYQLLHRVQAAIIKDEPFSEEMDGNYFNSEVEFDILNIAYEGEI